MGLHASDWGMGCLTDNCQPLPRGKPAAASHPCNVSGDLSFQLLGALQSMAPVMESKHILFSSCKPAQAQEGNAMQQSFVF